MLSPEHSENYTVAIFKKKKVLQQDSSAEKHRNSLIIKSVQVNTTYTLKYNLQAYLVFLSFALLHFTDTAVFTN